MVKLKRVKFDAIGLPDYLDNNCKGPFVRTEFCSHDIAAAEEKDEQALHTGAPYPQREWTEIPTFSSTKDFFLHWFHNVERQFKRSEIDHSLSYEDAGLIKFLGLLPAQIPRSRPDFSKGRPETFSLAHNDLDWQNILCDDYGNVTGIIDWEGACSRPSSFGWAQVPLFLRRDWDTDYRWPWDTLEYNLFPDQMQRFRKQYVAKLHDLEPRRGSDKGPSHPAISYLTCSLYDTCRYGPDDIRVWCDRFLRMVVPSVGEDFFHRAGMGKGWIFLPRLFEDETMPLNKWLEQYNIYHYLNHGCSSMELMLMEAPKPAKDCSKCWARDDHDNQSEYSVGDDSTKDRGNDKDATLFDEEDSRPRTPGTNVSLSASRALVKWNLLPQTTKTGDTEEETLRVHDIPLSTGANIEDSNLTAVATQSWPLPSHLHPCSSAEPALSSNTTGTFNQQTTPWNSDYSESTSSKVDSSTSKVTTEPFTSKMGALESCVTSSPLQHEGGKKSKSKTKLGRVPVKMMQCGRTLKNVMVRHFGRR
ncbi:hypothetical protein E2P81_ATG01421 [Venturia nashicola]|uniref:Aminoglycoside phosphotransferase domain-containing protein n=1 Tax=Venturia nashicola TaxID=86259 RepID=A0A4Z1PM58_9PEZI|nr:hypothetical protein E6O75_ATG01454 [Venturia nashicola]TLD38878.1 hypothetical protein E2P81_ATG01421 [Venturia nashicola]